MSDNVQHELGYFGNIWVRQHFLAKAGNAHPGHKHHFDHVTLLARGEVTVEIEGYEPKKFVAPTFIIVKKEHSHRIVAESDEVLYYCVFALRNLDGEVIEETYGAANNPYELPKHIDPTCASGPNRDES